MHRDGRSRSGARVLQALAQGRDARAPCAPGRRPGRDHGGTRTGWHAMRTERGSVWYGGGKLAADLTLPNLHPAVESEERSGTALGFVPDQDPRWEAERDLRATRWARAGPSRRISGAVRQRSGPRRGRRVGSGGRSPHGGPGAPGSGAAPNGGCLRAGRPRAVRPDPEMRARRRSRCRVGDADHRGRGLASGPAACRCATSRRAPSQGRREPPAQADRDARVRLRCRLPSVSRRGEEEGSRLVSGGSGK